MEEEPKKADYKTLLDMSNTIVASMGQTMLDMGLDIHLIWDQLGETLITDTIDLTEQTLGPTPDTDDLEELTEGWKELMLDSGLVQRLEILEVEDEQVKIDIGHCVFSPATQHFRDHFDDPNAIVPCPMMALYDGAIELATNKRSSIESAEFQADTDSTIFTMKLEEEITKED